MEDDDNLAEYLAANSASHKGRQGKNLYEAIVDVSTLALSFRSTSPASFVPSVIECGRLLGISAESDNLSKHTLKQLHFVWSMHPPSVTSAIAFPKSCCAIVDVCACDCWRYARRAL